MQTPKDQLKVLIDEYAEDFELLRQKYVKRFVEVFIANRMQEKKQTTYWLQEIERLENMIFFSAWIEDQFNDIVGYPWNYGYTKSRTKKIRKALGYNK